MCLPRRQQPEAAPAPRRRHLGRGVISRAAGVGFFAGFCSVGVFLWQSFAVPSLSGTSAGLAIPAPAAPSHLGKWSGARASSRGGHGEDAAAGPGLRTGFCAGIQVHLPGKSFKGSLNTFPPHSPCFAFSFFKHLIITLINTFWDNSSWLPSNLNQRLLAYCYVCVVC